MFLGDEDAGDTFSILASLTNSCKLLSVNPFQYWKDVLETLTNQDYEEIGDLLPDRWLASQLASSLAPH